MSTASQYHSVKLIVLGKRLYKQCLDDWELQREPCHNYQGVLAVLDVRDCVSNAVVDIENWITSINKWCASKRLQLNLTKSEIIWFRTTTSLRRLQGLNLGLHIGADIIRPVDVIRDVGVLLDTMLTTHQRDPEHLFLQLAAFEASPTATRFRYYSQTGFCICTQQAGLLQFRPGRPTTVDDRSSAGSTKCSSQANHVSRIT